MNERTVIERSKQLFVLGVIVFIVIGILLKDISYLLGFILGYIISSIVFQLIIRISDEIIKTSASRLYIIIFFISKMILYALGFIIAIKVSFINLLGVFVGYFTTKIAIYSEGYIKKGGEEGK